MNVSRIFASMFWIDALIIPVVDRMGSALMCRIERRLNVGVVFFMMVKIVRHVSSKFPFVFISNIIYFSIKL